jgi:hypothetical protein
MKSPLFMVAHSISPKSWAQLPSLLPPSLPPQTFHTSFPLPHLHMFCSVFIMARATIILQMESRVCDRPSHLLSDMLCTGGILNSRCLLRNPLPFPGQDAFHPTQPACRSSSMSSPHWLQTFWANSLPECPLSHRSSVDELLAKLNLLLELSPES